MKVALEYTSYWLLLPALLAPSKPLSPFVAATALVSAWSWHSPSLDRLDIDRFFARALFLLLLATCRDWYFVAGTLATYALSRLAMRTRQSELRQTLAHLLFRYVGFWWVHRALVGSPSCKVFSALSGAYWASVALLIEVENHLL